MVRQVGDEFEDIWPWRPGDCRKDSVIYCKCKGNPLNISDSEDQLGNLCCKIRIDEKRKMVKQLKAEEIQAREKEANNTD